ncbi:MAG TPA: HEAT repeat domain-containing protein [Gemmataceae bacterium]|nr:HEAT repeat domain-containing protein [Gemmataceae bacterium]
MPRGRFAPVLLLLLALIPGQTAPAAGVDGPTIAAADEQALKLARLPPSGTALVEFFRKRTPADVPEKTLTALVRQLADSSTAAQDRAFAELVSYGPMAVPLLRRAANDLDNPEVAERARRCLELIEGPEAAALVGAAARVLALFRPPGAAEVLLAYLPFADDDQVAEEVIQALTAVALRDGKPEPALLRALEDPIATRRAGAALVLSRVGGAEHRPTVRRLLHDPKASVRLQAALALAQANDAAAVPVLIDLLAELSPEQARPAEEFLTRLAGEWAITVPPGNDNLSRRLRRDLWAAWWRGTDGPLLLEEFRKRTPSDADREKIAGLIRQLDDPSPAAREQAVAELLTMGSAAVPLLRRAANDSGFRARDRARQCLQLLERERSAPLPAAAARLLALHRPAGAVAALLAYLPSVEDESMAGEIQAALAALAYQDGKPDPALVNALEDQVAERRAAAAEALCRGGATEQRQAVRRLLHDPEPTVRLRVALALAHARDRQAVPVLISLLAELPPELGVQVESCLRSLAGDQAPDILLGGEGGSPEKCRDAWAAWWNEHGHSIDLARLDAAQRLLGYTLVVEQYSQARRGGRVAEIDAAGKLRWEILGLQNPSDAQVVPGERVLIVEQGISQVSERDLKGNIIWQKQINLPLAAERLPNGNTFLAGRGLLLEVDRNGKEVFSYSRPGNDIMAAHKRPDGQIALLTYSWTYIRLDARGKEVKSFRIGPFPFYTNGIHFLPNDRVLVPEYNANRVAEYNAEGKRVWEAAVPMPSSVQRLPNGNTLVSSAAGQRIVELNRAGKVVWEHKENFNPWRARRR